MLPKLFDKWLRKRGQTSFLIFDLQVTDMDVVFEVIGQLESFQISREELEVHIKLKQKREIWVPFYPPFLSPVHAKLCFVVPFMILEVHDKFHH